MQGLEKLFKIRLPLVTLHFMLLDHVGLLSFAASYLIFCQMQIYQFSANAKVLINNLCDNTDMQEYRHCLSHLMQNKLIESTIWIHFGSSPENSQGLPRASLI